MGMAGIATGATVNDRFYVATISPATVAPNSTTTFNVSVTNDLKSGPSHFMRQIIVTVPAGFTLTNPPGAISPVAPPSGWKVQSIAGQVITVVTISSTDVATTAGKSVNIQVTAKAPASTPGNCTATQPYPWLLSANQDINGGNGNSYKLRPGTTTPTVTVASADCVTSTGLVLNSVSPTAVITTDAGAMVTLTATLTSAATNVGISGETVTFTVGGEPLRCLLNPAITSFSGVATCSFYPQAAPPNTPLTAGLYDIFANFAGDTVPQPDWGSSTSTAKQLTVSADGTNLAVLDASGPYNGTVNLSATLTTGATPSPLGGKTVTFSVNGTAAGSAVTDNAGKAAVSGVSLAGIPAGSYPQYIKASFAGDGTYSATSNQSTLNVSQLSSTITWGAPADIVYGTPLSGTQLNANASVAGSFVYSPAAGTILSGGNGPDIVGDIHAGRHD